MSLPVLFLDTNVFLDWLLHYRRKKNLCSSVLLEKIQNGKLKAYTADYVLSEILGYLKRAKEVHILGPDEARRLRRQILTPHDIDPMVSAIDRLKTIPNLDVFRPQTITQEEIFHCARTTCVDVNDALILLTALALRRKAIEITLVTRDERLIHRGKRLIDVTHPRRFMESCPQQCESLHKCWYRKGYKARRI